MHNLKESIKASFQLENSLAIAIGTIRNSFPYYREPGNYTDTLEAIGNYWKRMKAFKELEAHKFLICVSEFQKLFAILEKERWLDLNEETIEMQRLYGIWYNINKKLIGETR